MKSGGRLVYVTCSLLVEENEDRVAAFLAAHGDFSAMDMAEVAHKAGLEALLDLVPSHAASPPPPCGEGQGWGLNATKLARLPDPPPQAKSALPNSPTSPQGGREIRAQLPWASRFDRRKFTRTDFSSARYVGPEREAFRTKMSFPRKREASSPIL